MRCDGVWLLELKNLEDYAGLKGKAITDIAIKVSEGKVWYQVHTKSGWLPKASGYDIDDLENGYAGNGSKIDAIRVYYTTPQSIAESLNKYLVENGVTVNQISIHAINLEEYFLRKVGA